MFKKLAPWYTQLKEDFAGAIDPASKKQVLEDAKVVLDGILTGHPVGTAIANFIITELEATIHAVA